MVTAYPTLSQSLKKMDDGACLDESNGATRGQKGVSQVNRQEVRTKTEQIGIIPAVRVSSADDARIAAETINAGAFLSRRSP